MVDFTQINYLKEGNAKQRKVFHLLKSSNILDRLADYTPVLAGTVPIAVDTDESDLDILCYWKDRSKFIKAVSTFENEMGFKSITKEINGRVTVLAQFILDGFQIEIFGQNRPVLQQEAYRHMLIEHKILCIKGESFRDQIIALKKAGFKTETAFASLLNLKGNPFTSLLYYNPG